MELVKLQKTVTYGLGTLFVAGILATVSGCGSPAPTATDQDEMKQYLEEHPELKDPEPDESNTERLDDPDAANFKPGPV